MPAEPTTVAGLALAACSVLGTVIAYLFAAWTKERKELMEKIESLQTARITDTQTVQAARVADAQRAPADLLKLSQDSVLTLSENTKTNAALVKALTELREGVEELPEEVVRSIKAKAAKS